MSGLVKRNIGDYENYVNSNYVNAGLKDWEILELGNFEIALMRKAC